MKIMFLFAARRVLGLPLLLLLLTAAAAAQSAQSAQIARDTAFEAAHASYERNHWPEAYAGFAALADAGDAEAAVIALQMVRRGLVLFGTAFAANPDQLRLWARLTACNSGAGGRACGAAQR